MRRVRPPPFKPCGAAIPTDHTSKHVLTCLYASDNIRPVRLVAGDQLADIMRWVDSEKGLGAPMRNVGPQPPKKQRTTENGRTCSQKMVSGLRISLALTRNGLVGVGTKIIGMVNWIHRTVCYLASRHTSGMPGKIGVAQIVRKHRARDINYAHDNRIHLC